MGFKEDFKEGVKEGRTSIAMNPNVGIVIMVLSLIVCGLCIALFYLNL